MTSHTYIISWTSHMISLADKWSFPKSLTIRCACFPLLQIENILHDNHWSCILQNDHLTSAQTLGDANRQKYLLSRTTAMQKPVQITESTVHIRLTNHSKTSQVASIMNNHHCSKLKSMHTSVNENKSPIQTDIPSPLFHRTDPLPEEAPAVSYWCQICNDCNSADRKSVV